MADFESPLANNSRTCNTSSPLYMPSPPLSRVWRRRSSEVGIFHSGDFAEYVSGGFVHFSSGDDTSRTCRPPRAPGTQAISPMVHLSAGEAWRERTPLSRHGPRGVTVCARGVLPPARVQKNSHGEKSQCAKVVA